MFVRTKDNRIYQFVKIEEHGRMLEGYANQEEINTYLGGTFLGKDNILKQADTIEELCDEFVSVSKAFGKPRLVYGTIKEIYDDLCNFEEIYGAIWTDKGLVYVAKMNEKGELELL